jgi:TonB family protein
VLKKTDSNNGIAFDDSGMTKPAEDPTAYPVAAADFIARIKPQYPEFAREENAQGQVIIHIVLDARETLLDARVAKSSGNDLLDAAALKAARKSTYAPPKMAPSAPKIPLVSTYSVMYIFALN